MSLAKKASSPTSLTSTGTSLLKLTIPSGQATPSPPIGPALGQKGVKAIDFCKRFNESSTRLFLPGTPLRVQITVNAADRSFTFLVRPPPTSWMVWRILKAASSDAVKGSSERVVARIPAPYAYEIARVKKVMDPEMQHLPLRSIYRMVIHSARTFGVVFY